MRCHARPVGVCACERQAGRSKPLPDNPRPSPSLRIILPVWQGGVLYQSLFLSPRAIRTVPAPISPFDTRAHWWDSTVVSFGERAGRRCRSPHHCPFPGQLERGRGRVAGMGLHDHGDGDGIGWAGSEQETEEHPPTTSFGRLWLHELQLVCSWLCCLWK